MIIGIDPSLSATGIACLDQGTVSLSTIQSSPGPIEPRLLAIVRQVGAAIDKASATGQIAGVGIEGLSNGSLSQSGNERAALHFAIRMALYMRGIPFVIVSPMSLKKFVCGKATVKGDEGKQVPAGKEHMLKAILQNFGVDTSDNNQADAAGLAFVVAAIQKQYTPINSGQRDVIAKLMAPPVVKKTRRKKAA